MKSIPQKNTWKNADRTHSKKDTKKKKLDCKSIKIKLTGMWTAIKEEIKPLFLPLLSGVLLCIIFRQPLVALLNTLLVDPFLSQVQSSWETDLAVIALLILYIIYVFRNAYPERPARDMAFSALIIAIYLLLQLGHHYWTFTPFQCMGSVAYADAVYLLVGVVVVRLIVISLFKRNDGAADNKTLNPDASITDATQDKLGYQAYAQALANKIKEINPKEAFAIGINSKWGTGKTSFVNLIKSELAKPADHLIIIDFNPWRSNSSSVIIRDFFDTLKATLSKHILFLPWVLDTYAARLSGTSDNFMTQALKAIGSLMGRSDSTASLFDEINRTLSRLHKKIVVCIDDLDRLDQHEIMEVFRLIRNTGSFNNMVFIMPYDKNYLQAAIEKYNPSEAGSFVEKIVQLEVQLPYYEPEKLLSLLIKQLEAYFPNQQEGITQIQQFFKESDFSYWIGSPRTVFRLANGFFSSIYHIEKDVVFHEFFLLELFRQKFPMIYQNISKESTTAFNYTDTQWVQPYAGLASPFPNDNYGVALRQYLTQYESIGSVTKKDIDHINTLFRYIISNTNAPANSFSYRSNFEKYFSYRLDDHHIRQDEFDAAFDLSDENFQHAITGWIQNNPYDLALKLQSRSAHKQTILAIYWLGSLSNVSPLPDEALEDLFIRHLHKLGDYQSYLSELEAPHTKFSASFMAQVAATAMQPRPHTSDTDLTNAILETSVKLLQHHQRDKLGLRPEIIGRFSVLTQDYASYAAMSSYLTSIRETLRDLIRDNRDTFLQMIISPAVPRMLHAGDYELSIISTSSIVAIFGGWSDFEKEIGSWTASDNQKEFNRFLAALSANSYKPVPFTFKKIPVREPLPYAPSPFTDVSIP
ncbi:MAG: P-loop NTPase fold protein [Bacteroidia bacterium]|nr:P-loop NTPase fold protein [Bacteroidia bacterium]